MPTLYILLCRLCKRSYVALLLFWRYWSIANLFLNMIIGKRSEPPSDQLGGEFFISSCALVGLSLYIHLYGYTYGLSTNTMPTHIVSAHSHYSWHCAEETKTEKETALKGLSQTNICYSYQQELLYFRGILVLIIKMLHVIK